MTDGGPVDLAVVGSVGIDAIETPHAKRDHLLGGSATYACAAASFFARPGLVGVVGDDFGPDRAEALRAFGIDLAGLRTESGSTFFWSGVYEDNMDRRSTRVTELGVFENFRPDLPEAYRDAPFVLLGNMHPQLQLDVLDQIRNPRFVAADTMDLWISTTHRQLMEVLARVDLLTLNETEAQQLTGEHGLVRAAVALLEAGPAYVLVKKGAHGSMLVTRASRFILPAYPVEEVTDPTGAGDTFAGAMMGALAAGGEVSEPALRRAMVAGTVVASFGVQDFSLDALRPLDRARIQGRIDDFRRMLAVD